MPAINATELNNTLAGGFEIPFIPGGGIISSITGLIVGLLSIVFSFAAAIIWFLGFILNAGVYWFGHISLMLMFIEIFLIGLSVIFGKGNPIKIIHSYINFHFQVLYIFFMLAYYLISLIYDGIIALTTWIP